MRNVLEYMEASAARCPDKIAVLDDTDKCTYRQLETMSQSIGVVLSKYVTPGKPVAVLMKKSVLTLETFFGIAYAGGFYCLVDPDFPTERIGNMISTLDPEVVITKHDNIAILDACGYTGKVIIADDLISEASGVDLNSETTKPLSDIRDANPDNAPLYCNFTSGSTGVPKGVLVGHDTVIEFIDDFTEMFDITEADVIGNQAPFDFDVSVKDIYSAMKVGATMVIIPTAFFRLPNQVMDMLEENKVTTLIWAVSALVLINRLHEFTYKVPPCINKVLFSGEQMPVKHLADWMKQYPDATFVNLYGPTEITCNCTWYRIESIPSEDEKIPAGHPFPHKNILLVSPEGKAVPVEEEEVTGEVCVYGGGLAIGYYNNQKATDAAFVYDSKHFENETRLYKTGDLAYYKDGLLYFAGRKDFQIKHNGHRIELEEIERAATGLEQVAQSACLFDENKQRIVMFYTGTEDRKGIVAGLKNKVPAYMIPNVFRFVEDFPLTKNGKTDRNALKQMYFESVSGKAKKSK